MHAGPDSHITFRKLSKYKYELVDDYPYPTAIPLPAAVETNLGFAKMAADGLLTLKRGYAWDGATRAPDTKSILRGSLVHDGLYQLISTGLIDRSHKDAADRLLQKICRDDGMSRPAAWVVYQAVRRFRRARSRTPDAPITIP